MILKSPFIAGLGSLLIRVLSFPEEYETDVTHLISFEETSKNNFDISIFFERSAVCLPEPQFDFGPLKSQKEVKVVMPDYADAQDYSRAIRKCWIKLLVNLGYNGVHASAVEADSKVFLMVGDSHSGKTTCMLSCLSTGKFNYLGNDRVIVKQSKQGIVAAPLGYSLGIRHPVANKYLPTLEVESGFASATEKLPGGKFRYSERKIAELFNCNLSAGGDVVGIIFPNFDARSKKFEVASINAFDAEILWQRQSLEFGCFPQDDFQHSAQRKSILPVSILLRKVSFGGNNEKEFGEYVFSQMEAGNVQI